jgi:hypothetical protein
MTNYKLNDMNLSIGLCEITYGDIILPSMGSEGKFQAIPKYRKMFGGKLNSTQRYLLEQYDVSFEVEFDMEAIEVMKFYMPTLQNHQTINESYDTGDPDFGIINTYNDGYYDNPQNVDMSKNRLVIHPYTANSSKQYDICIWRAYIDPETGFQRVYGKETNKYKVKFIGTVVDNHADPNIINSYFYIGDWSKVGDSDA